MKKKFIEEVDKSKGRSRYDSKKRFSSKEEDFTEGLKQKGKHRKKLDLNDWDEELEGFDDAM